MAKELKTIIYKHLERRFGDLDGCVLVDFRGLNSEQTLDLRGVLRKSGVLFNVVQNRLARRLFKEKGAPEDFQALFKGPTAILFGSDGAITASKAIAQWRKKNKNAAALKGGFFGGKALSPAEVERLATLPDVPTLRSSIASLFLSPLSSLAQAAAALLGHFPGCVKAHAQSLPQPQEAA
jgi:large subunit ribosomal protein L10